MKCLAAAVVVLAAATVAGPADYPRPELLVEPAALVRPGADRFVVLDARDKAEYAAGAKDVRNYYRSWSEWGNADDTPVVKPAPKK